MALEILDAPGLGNFFLDHASIADNGQFLYPAEEEITTGDLLNLVDFHSSHMRKHYKDEYKYFKGDHAIKEAKHKALYKPDNRLIFNFPRKVVTTFNGFFMGSPIKIDSEKDKQTDQFVANWINTANFDALASQVSKMSSMYGHAYFLVYQSDPTDPTKNGEPRIAAVSPMDAFLIYDDTIEHQVKYGVTYRRNYQRQLEITLYDAHLKRDFVSNVSSSDFLDNIRTVINPYGMVPLIEADENDERMAICEDVMTLIDGLDKAMSEKANDNDYFADAILKIKGAKLNVDQDKEMRENRLLNLVGQDAKDSDAEFLAKPDADATQEHLIDRLVQSIYEIANITNLNDDAFNGNPSGVSLRMKYQAMDNMAQDKTHQFKATLRNLFKCVFAVSYSQIDDAAAWQKLKFTFTRTIPVNLLEDAQVVNFMAGKVSNHTLFSVLPFIDDPDAEIQRMKDEQKDSMDATNGAVQQMLSAQTDQQKAGGVDDHGQAGASSNSSSDQTGQSNK